MTTDLQLTAIMAVHQAGPAGVSNAVLAQAVGVTVRRLAEVMQTPRRQGRCIWVCEFYGCGLWAAPEHAADLRTRLAAEAKARSDAALQRKRARANQKSRDKKRELADARIAVKAKRAQELERMAAEVKLFGPMRKAAPAGMVRPRGKKKPQPVMPAAPLSVFSQGAHQ